MRLHARRPGEIQRAQPVERARRARDANDDPPLRHGSGPNQSSARKLSAMRFESSSVSTSSGEPHGIEWNMASFRTVTPGAELAERTFGALGNARSA